MTEKQDEDGTADTCSCCRKSEDTAQVRGVWLCDECAAFLKPRWDEQQARVQALEAEIAEAREACPIVRRQDYADARLLTLIEAEIGQLFQAQSRAEAAEAQVQELAANWLAVEKDRGAAVVALETANLKIAALEREVAELRKVKEKAIENDRLRREAVAEALRAANELAEP